MKNKTNFFIFITLILAFTGIYFFHEYLEKAIAIKKDKESIIFDFDKNDVIKLGINNDKGKMIFEKKENGLWYMTFPENTLADNRTIKDILTYFSHLHKKDSIGNDVNLKKYELDERFIDLNFSFKDGRNESLHIGDTTPSGDCNYAIKENSKEVVLICSSFISFLSRNPIEYENKSLWAENQDIVKDKITKVIIEKNGASFSIERDISGGWVAKGNNKASAGEVESFIKDLKTSECIFVINISKRFMERFGLIKPQYKIYVFCENLDKPLELDVGKFNKERNIGWVKTSIPPKIEGLGQYFFNALENLYK